MNDTVWVVGFDGRFIDANFYKNVEGWVSIINPEWQQIMSDYFTMEVIGNKKNFDKELLFLRYQ